MLDNIEWGISYSKRVLKTLDANPECWNLTATTRLLSTFSGLVADRTNKRRSIPM